MKTFFAVSTTMRLAFWFFVLGLAVGLFLGVRV